MRSPRRSHWRRDSACLPSIVQSFQMLMGRLVRPVPFLVPRCAAFSRGGWVVTPSTGRFNDEYGKYGLNRPHLHGKIRTTDRPLLHARLPGLWASRDDALMMAKKEAHGRACAPYPT